MSNRPDYSNWVSKRIPLYTGLARVFFAALFDMLGTAFCA